MFIYFSYVVIKISRRKLDKIMNELTNLFGVSVFTVSLFQLITLSMQLNILELFWHAFMMHSNIIFLNDKIQEKTYKIQYGMQVILTIIHQSRSIVGTMVDLNLLFELISLYHLLITEEKVTIHQLLFIKKHVGSDLKAKNRIENQENCIKYWMNATTVFILIVKIFGCLPRFLVFDMYTKLTSNHHHEFAMEL